MYLPELFAHDDETSKLTFIHKHPFATLMSVVDASVAVSQLPVTYCKQRHALLTHFAKVNPLTQALGSECKVLFSGTDAYISPKWTEHLEPNDVVVPTWNYSALEVTGPLQLVTGDEEKQIVMEQIVSKFEMSEGNPWSMNYLKPSLLKQMLKAIHVCVIPIVEWRLKHKWSQNKSEQTQQIMKEKVQAQLLTRCKAELGLNHI